MNTLSRLLLQTHTHLNCIREFTENKHPFYSLMPIVSWLRFRLTWCFSVVEWSGIVFSPRKSLKKLFNYDKPCWHPYILNYPSRCLHFNLQNVPIMTRVVCLSFVLILSPRWLFVLSFRIACAKLLLIREFGEVWQGPFKPSSCRVFHLFPERI